MNVATRFNCPRCNQPEPAAAVDPTTIPAYKAKPHKILELHNDHGQIAHSLGRDVSSLQHVAPGRRYHDGLLSQAQSGPCSTLLHA